MASAGVYQDNNDLKKQGKRILKAPGMNEGNPILAGSKWEDKGQQQQAQSAYQQRRPQEKGASVAESKHATSESREAGRLNKMKYTSGGAPFATQGAYPFEEGSAPQYKQTFDQGEGVHSSRSDAPNGLPTPGRVLGKAPVSDYNPITWGVDESESASSDYMAASAAHADVLITSVPQRFKGRGLANSAGKSGHAKVSTHNPLTWERYDGAEAEDGDDKSMTNRLRPAAPGNKKSAYNPITGKDYEEFEDDDIQQQQQLSRRVMAHQ